MQQRAQSLAARLGAAFPRLESGDGCVVAAPTPRQPNSFDCGVCTLEAAEQLARGWVRDSTLPEALEADRFTAKGLAAKRGELLSQLDTAKSCFG